MRVMARVLLLLLVCEGVLHAQVPKANIFLGYSYLNADLNTSARSNLNGWDGSVEGKILPFIGIVGDFSGHYGTVSRGFVCPSIANVGCPSTVNAKFHTALFGPRVSASFGGVRPFAHLLVGAGITSESGGGASTSDTSLATAVGGGADFRIAPIIGWRLQADYIHAHFLGESTGHMRLSTGIVLRF